MRSTAESPVSGRGYCAAMVELGADLSSPSSLCRFSFSIKGDGDGRGVSATVGAGLNAAVGAVGDDTGGPEGINATASLPSSASIVPMTRLEMARVRFAKGTNASTTLLKVTLSRICIALPAMSRVREGVLGLALIIEADDGGDGQLPLQAAAELGLDHARASVHERSGLQGFAAYSRGRLVGVQVALQCAIGGDKRGEQGKGDDPTRSARPDIAAGQAATHWSIITK